MYICSILFTINLDTQHLANICRGEILYLLLVVYRVKNYYYLFFNLAEYHLAKTNCLTVALN